MSGKTVCGDCGMPVGPDDFHPFAACLMFEACRNSMTVEANLEFFRGYFVLESATRLAEKDAQIAALSEKLVRIRLFAKEAKRNINADGIDFYMDEILREVEDA